MSDLERLIEIAQVLPPAKVQVCPGLKRDSLRCNGGGRTTPRGMTVAELRTSLSGRLLHLQSVLGWDSFDVVDHHELDRHSLGV